MSNLLQTTVDYISIVTGVLMVKYHSRQTAILKGVHLQTQGTYGTAPILKTSLMKIKTQRAQKTILNSQ